MAVVGSLSRDVVAGGAPRAGGAVYYAARAFARMGEDACVVARCGEEDRELLLPPLQALGRPVEFRAGTRTTAFSFHYEGDHRVMHVDEVGDPWTVADAGGWVAEALGTTGWVQVGALLRTDFDAHVLAVLASGGRHLLVDAQGLVRASAIGPLQRDAQVDPAVFASLSALKLNEDEARVLCGGVDADRLRRLGVPEILVTLGSAGALVVTATESERIPPVPLGAVVDPTGAGDSFCAAYACARAQGAEPVEAARSANTLAAEVLGQAGGA